MDWFLHDRDLRHESIDTLSNIKRFGEIENNLAEPFCKNSRYILAINYFHKKHHPVTNFFRNKASL